MANLVALDQFNIDNIDLNFYARNFLEDALTKNANLTLNGVTYPDWYWVNGYDGFANLELDFLGTGFTWNEAKEFTGGTVNAIVELDLDAESVLWVIQNISVPATAIYGAALTESPADEFALVTAALSGNDLIVLSPYADKISGYAGNDVIRGNGGNDDLDGGAGLDTAVFTGDRSEYSVTQAAGVFTVVGPDGTDTIRNFEFAQFDDQTMPLSVNNSPVGSARLYLSAGNLTYGPVPGGDQTFVFGSNQAERVTLAANANAVFDPSFVRGNDVVAILGDASAYSISANVAGITISSDNGAQFRIPGFGTEGGLQIQFENGAVQLGTDDGGNTFHLTGVAGEQAITGTVTAISSAIMSIA